MDKWCKTEFHDKRHPLILNSITNFIYQFHFVPHGVFFNANLVKLPNPRISYVTLEKFVALF